jgi:hypothetical protein
MADLGPISRQYLVRTEAGAVVLHGQESHASRVLVPRVRGVLYDPALELLWFVDEDRLGVVDLRAPQSGPIIVARGVPRHVARLSIDHPSGLAETEDDCDLDQLSLEWTPAARVYVADPDASQPRIENGSWMEAQRTRVPRATGRRRGFSDAHVQLPRAVMACEERDRCGAAIPFGGLALQLVLAAEKMGGDCMHRGCMLLNPKTHLYAQPAEAAVWQRAGDAPLGSCGLFMFDEAGTTFLVAGKLCAPGIPCHDHGGRALGWMVPGDIVGAPGFP